MSPVDICNIALAHIGDRRITRLDSDAQIEDALVRYCAEYYELAKNQALEAHRWSFAKTPAVLVREGSPVLIGDYLYSHVMPTDNLRLLTVYRGIVSTEDDSVSFIGTVDHFKLVNSRKLWSREKEVAIEYIAKQTDPNLWSSHFQAAVARLLAHYLAGVIADNPGDAMRHLELYERNALPNAQYYDSVQDNSGENDDLGIIRADSEFLKTRRAAISSSYPEDY